MKPIVLMCVVMALGLPGLAQDGDAGGGDSLTIKIDKELEVRDLLDEISKAVGRPLLYDPNGQRIRGQKVGVTINQTVPKARAFDTFRAILAFYELTLIPVGPDGHGMWLVVDSRSTNNFIKNKATWVGPNDVQSYADRDGLYIACAFPLQHVRNLTTVRTALSTMVSPAGIGRVHEYSGGVLVMDFAPTVAAISRILRQMDTEAASTAPVMETIELEHAEAPLVAATLNSMLAEPDEDRKVNAQRRASGMAPMQARVVPYEPRNALVVYASRAEADRIKQLVTSLDLPARAWKAGK